MNNLIPNAVGGLSPVEEESGLTLDVNLPLENIPTIQALPYCVDHTDEHVDCPVKVHEALQALFIANNFHMNWALIHMARALRRKAYNYDLRQAANHLELFGEVCQAEAETGKPDGPPFYHIEEMPTSIE